MDSSRPTQPTEAMDVPSHSCSTCGKAYSRSDHLERHRRTHSQMKPYTCPVCRKDFARHDVLKRHELNHDQGPAAKRQKSSGPPRSRVAKACQHCAAAKLKCDDKKPCTRCGLKQLTCVFSRASSPAPGEQDNMSGLVAGNSLISSDTDTFEHYVHGQGIRFPSEETHEVIDMNVHLDGQPDFRFDLSGPLNPAPVSQGDVACPGPSAQSTVHASKSTNEHQAPPSISDMMDESSLAQFLNDILLPTTPAPDSQFLPHEQSNQPHTQRDFLDLGTWWVDAPDQANLPTTYELDSRVGQNNFPLAPPPASGSITPITGDGMRLANAAFSRSMWRWIPAKADHEGLDQLHLSLPSGDMDSPTTRAAAASLFAQRLISDTSRDKILARILSVCDESAYLDVVSSFPTTELLNGLMHNYLHNEAERMDSWLHLPTLTVDDLNLELAIMIVSAGAVICSVSAIRKLGFALQEAAREAIHRKFEGDNRLTRDLQTLQAFALQIQVGLWSGDKRKMEIAESFAQPLITMMRRGDYFRQARTHHSPPSLEDSGEGLESKWRQWVVAESSKRLACHMIIHDAQSSMVHQVSPLLSPTEFSIELPASRKLWCARNAEEWRLAYLSLDLTAHDRSLSVAQSVHNVAQLQHQARLDVSFSATVAVYCMWSSVWSQLQLNHVIRTHSGSFVTSMGDQTLPQLLEQLRMIFSDWDGSYRPEMKLALERTLLNLYVPFAQVQSYAGKEGEDEARRVLPMLRQWATSSDARKGIWHAGQVLKAAHSCPPGCLRAFEAVCLYHAGIAFWTYAMVSALAVKQRYPPQRVDPQMTEGDCVWLDGDDCPALQRFVVLNRGNPFVHGWTGVAVDKTAPVSIDNPQAIMDECIELLKRNNRTDQDGTPLPLVENLCQLMRDLGNAARVILR